VNTASKRLKKLRIKAGLNQSQLARKVGVTRAAASRWEQGDIESILARNALSVANALKTDVQYLFTGRCNTNPLDVESLTRAIKIVEQSLDDLTPTGKANIINLVYQLMTEGRQVSRKAVRELQKTA
jgi:transcriptional regulator with XRE-family HTH domain